MADIIIFGVQDLAQLAHYYLTNDSPHTVVAFSVSDEYIPDEKTFMDLPVIPFSKIETLYSVKDYSFFAPMSHSHMNRDRESVYLSIKAKGYNLISYISSRAYVSNNEIGENCFILEDNTIQPYTNIGNNVVLWSGNHIGHHSEIDDHVFFTSHVVMSGHCHIESNTFIGVNATLRDGITIAKGTLVAMGAIITKSTDPWGVYVGSPAKKGEKRSDEIGV